MAKYPRYYTDNMFDIHHAANYFCKLAEERAMVAAEGRLEINESWFQREFKSVKECILFYLDCYVKAVAEKPASYWIENYEKRISTLVRCREDHLMQGSLTEGMDEEYKREIAWEMKKIRKIKAHLKKQAKKTTGQC